MDYGSWDDNRQRLIEALDRCASHNDKHLREKATDLLDGAAQSARSGNLVVAAQYLMDYRHIALREHPGFWRSWDDGILVFCDLVRQVQDMSPTPDIPAPYQQLLNAQPSLSYDSSLTPWQRAFWYGSPDLSL